jgi:hypothetical protein
MCSASGISRQIAGAKKSTNCTSRHSLDTPAAYIAPVAPPSGRDSTWADAKNVAKTPMNGLLIIEPGGKFWTGIRRRVIPAAML